MIMRLGIAALAAAFLAGCQTTVPAENQWTRRDATPEDVKRDLYWCTRTVEHRRAVQTPADERRVSQIVDDECMERRGYSKKG